jgi:hypothetical protein
MLHMSAGDGGSVLVSVWFSVRPFPCGLRLFLHMGYVEVCCRHVHVNVALQRRF